MYYITHYIFLITFQACEFTPFSDSHFHIGCIDSTTEDPGPSIAEKQKFPLKYFPENRWSRKGYLRTRWSLNGTQLDLINIHLFHDASNLVSVEEVPSIYCNFRRKALQYTLDKVQADQHQSLPLFIFGDFNFRLEGKSVLTKLTRGLSRQCSETPDRVTDHVQFLNDQDQLVLSIGKKEFTLETAHDETFQDSWNQWTEYDQEKENIAERLSEAPLNFPPTYPFQEDPDAGAKYMRTRCPAWCDRVLFSHPTRQIMESPEESCQYDIIGRTVCMGDHKPVFLQFRLKPDVSNVDIPTYSRSNSPGSNSNYLQQQGSKESPTKCPRVESPNYTDLLNNEHLKDDHPLDTDSPAAGSPCTRYIEIKDVNNVKLFKETTV